MKTAISIPNNVFESAEKLASRLGKSRSQLYTQALNSYVVKHQNDLVTQKLNEIYGSESSALDKTLSTIQFESTSKDVW